MTIDFEKAAISALKTLKSMPIEELTIKIESNINTIFSKSIRGLWYPNYSTEIQTYTYSIMDVVEYVPINDNSYKKFETESIEKHIQLKLAS